MNLHAKSLRVSIPQAVSTVATVLSSQTSEQNMLVSIPQAVSTVATSEATKAVLEDLA